MSGRLMLPGQISMFRSSTTSRLKSCKNLFSSVNYDCFVIVVVNVVVVVLIVLAVHKELVVVDKSLSDSY